MNRILCSAQGAAVIAIALTACDPAPPASAPSSDAGESQAVEPRAVEPTTLDEPVSDGVREALADMLRDKDAFSRARRLGALLPTLDAASVPAVKQTLGDAKLDLGATELELLVRFWATHQPEEASRWALERSSPVYRVGTLFSALTVWAEANPQAAASAASGWAEDTPSLAGIVPVAVVRGWFNANDPPELRQHIQDLGVGFPRQRSLAAYVRAVTQARGANALVRWAESLPDDDERYKLAVYRHVASALWEFDQKAALRWCEAHCDGPYGKDLRSRIARRWVAQDGPSALAWLSNGPEGKDTDFAVRLTFAAWARRDREPALAWMASQAAGELETWLRPILSVYALLLAEDSPAHAIEWAERIECDEDREKVLVLIVREWHRVDETEAEAWLLQSSLSEEARQRTRGS